MTARGRGIGHPQLPCRLLKPCVGRGFIAEGIQEEVVPVISGMTRMTDMHDSIIEVEKHEEIKDLVKSLTLEELQSAVLTILEVSTCPVCLDVLLPSSFLCVNGHPICEQCYRSLQECPVCRKEFSNVKPQGFVRQVVLALPHQCSHDQCSYIVKVGDDHELYCGFSKCACCKLCDWLGFRKDIQQHVNDDHSEIEIQKNNFSCEYQNFYLFRDSSKFLPILAYEQFFWMEQDFDPNRGLMSIKLHSVPNKKSFDLEAEAVFDAGNYIVKMKLNMDPSVDSNHNTFHIPMPILRNCIKDCNTLIYKFSIKSV